MINPGEHVVYRWQRQGTGHYYIGVHTCKPNGKCNRHECRYTGSGVAFLKSYKANPELWERHIVARCLCHEEALWLEQQLIADKFRYGANPDPLCLNLSAGGLGATPATLSALRKDPNSKWNTVEHHESIKAQRHRYWASEQGQAQRERSRANGGPRKYYGEDSQEKHRAALKEYFRQNPVPQEMKQRQSDVLRARTPVKLKDPAGVEQVVNRDDVKQLLAAGWCFIPRTVYVHHDALQVCCMAMQTTAVRLIVEEGWTYGRARSYTVVRVSDIPQLTAEHLKNQ